MFSDEHTHPGYVKFELCLAYSGVGTQFMEALKGDPFGLYKHFITDKQNRILICNSYGRRIEMCDEINGPARTEVLSNEYYRVSIDRVLAFYSRTWPLQALPWFNRRCNKQWPSEHTVKFIKTLGCFVTPTGHPFSSERDLEWRLSLALAERYLVWSLNETQFKCLILMKMIIKKFIQPWFGDTITTYHCKMCLFSILEETHPSMWKPQNILLCMRKCIFRLLECVIDGNVPQYFIPENNLLEHKVNNFQRQLISNTLEGLLNSNFRFLLEIQNDDIGYLISLQFSKLDNLPFNIPGQVTDRTHKLECSLPLPSIDLLIFWKAKILWTIKNDSDLITIIQHHFKLLRQLSNSIVEYEAFDALTVPKQLMQYALSHTAHSLGYHLIIFGLRTKLSDHYAKEIISLGLQFVTNGVHDSEISNLLKLAALLYNCKLHKEMETILHYAKNHYSDNIFSICGCNHPTNNITENNMEVLFESSFDELVTKYVSSCTIYLPSEADIAPTAMLYETFRSSGCVENSANRARWSNTGVCDTVTYMHYLTFLCYYALDNGKEMEEAILNLAEAIISEPNLGHPETALNLLGHCYMIKEDFISAFDCFKRSLSVFVKEDNPRHTLQNQHLHNAAKWHLAILLFKIWQRLKYFLGVL